MLKIGLNFLIFGAFLLMVLTFGFFLWQTLFNSPSGEGEIQDKPAYNQQQSAVLTGSTSSAIKASTDEAVAEYTKWLAIFTMFLVLATLGLFVSGERNVEVARRAAQAANRSAQLAEDSLTKLQRAFVTFQQMRYLSHTDSDGKVWWSLHFNWHNSGTSPARKVRLFVSKYFEDADIPDDFKFEIPADRSTNFMGPNSSMQVNAYSVTADELVAVREGKKFLYLWGRADYNDIFDGTPSHVTKFAMRVRDFRGDPTKEWNEKTNVVEIIMDNSPARHNCADEDCN